MTKREFTVANEYRYNRSSPVRWIISHLFRYPWFPAAVVASNVLSSSLRTAPAFLTGTIFDELLTPVPDTRRILLLSLGILGAWLLMGVLGLAYSWSIETLGQRLERDARDELALSLLGKSQTFHDRQRVGDIMARATNDVRQLNLMMNPGIALIFGSLLSLVVPLISIGLLRWQLLLVPLLFVAAFGVTLRRYMDQMGPVAGQLRMQFGVMNAGLAERISGIEVVKAYAQEAQEQARFSADARAFRDLFVEQGRVQARYLPLLFYGVALGLGFFHALWLWRTGVMPAGDVIAFMGLFGVLRFPTFISIFSFSLVQLGLAAAERILALLNDQTDLDENAAGLARPIRGEVLFENVRFGYGPGSPVLKNISFRARPGETIAIVGQTGSGKSTLTKLVNRIYDVDAGRVLVDGADVRDWQLESLRGQISTIEQDIFLFSRTIADNIAFGAPNASREDVERAAREAQAHDFIMSMPQGYESEIGERGVTLSGGQRQRIAIARAFLTDPRILVLDDSTSAIDSATEDEIQKAMRRIMQGRTTFLITHRLSQIRWADHILVLRRGELVDQGTHEELLDRSPDYRRIFARHTMPEAMSYEL
ncbi:MAG TPA: ABC transporter ATP-binding protein [Ardenticatenaceae bacterium]|nr:ABC transporter ATP-binding protein [Ardenticatenaceae bacterium]